MTLTISGNRGCGNKRKAGKIYLCCGFSEYGCQIEDFICDPGIPYRYNYHRSPKLYVDKNGINHVYMWIGEEFYKSPWFHIRETSKLGLSRLVSDSFPIDKLIPNKSKIRCIYPYGIPKFQWVNLGGIYDKCHLDNDCHGEHKVPINKLQFYEAYKFCAFAHRDLSIYFANKKQSSVNEIGDNFRICFPNKENCEVIYDGFTPNVDENINVLDKKNWQAAILLDLPITHIEIPYIKNEKVVEKINNVGYETFITDW